MSCSLSHSLGYWSVLHEDLSLEHMALSLCPFPSSSFTVGEMAIVGDVSWALTILSTVTDVMDTIRLEGGNNF